MKHGIYYIALFVHFNLHISVFIVTRICEASIIHDNELGFMVSRGNPPDGVHLEHAFQNKFQKILQVLRAIVVCSKFAYPPANLGFNFEITLMSGEEDVGAIPIQPRLEKGVFNSVPAKDVPDNEL